MKIYTKTGDDGTTGLFAGPRVQKDDARIEAYGSVDELNATLGMVRVEHPPREIEESLARAQHELFDLGAELATPDPKGMGLPQIDEQDIERLEREIDAFDARLPPLKQFVLPHGSRVATALHVARTVCRRAERRVVSLANQEGAGVSPTLVTYLNRLSDLLFTMARFANLASGHGDTPWRSKNARGS